MPWIDLFETPQGTLQAEDFQKHPTTLERCRADSYGKASIEDYGEAV
jgi:hypothetical protein